MKYKRKYGPALWTLLPNGKMIPSASAVKRIMQSRYQRKAAVFKKKHPLCQACVKLGEKPRRTRDIHHVHGRAGDRLLDDTRWLAVCGICHNWIHSHPNEARKLGLIAPLGKWNA